MNRPSLRPLAPRLDIPPGLRFDAEPGSATFQAQRQHYRRLAIQVINLALRDLTSPVGSAADRASARAFLAGSGMLSHWCAVAELDPARLVRHSTRLRASFRANNS